jgi:hypothetical protein
VPRSNRRQIISVPAAVDREVVSGIKFARTAGNLREAATIMTFSNPPVCWDPPGHRNRAFVATQGKLS